MDIVASASLRWPLAARAMATMALGWECGDENIRFAIFEHREGFLVFSCIEEGEGIGGA